MLPYVRVRYEFSAARVSAPSITYYGCIMGQARRLHDLVSKKYFTPGLYDCGGDPNSAVDFDLKYNSNELVIAPYEYPAIVDGNVIDTDTVKAYIRDLTYIGMYKVRGEADLAAGQYIGIPAGTDKSAVRIAVVDEAPLDVSGMFTIQEQTIDTVDYITVDASSLLAAGSGKYIVPGTLCVSFKTDSRDVVISDFAVSEDETEVNSTGSHNSTAPVNGKLRVYASDYATDFEIALNNMEINYETGAITGGIRIKTSDSLPGDTYVKNVWTATPADLCNVNAGDDYFVLSRRSYTEAVGYAGVGLIADVAPGTAPAGGVTLEFTGTEADMQTAYIKNEFSASVPDTDGPQQDNTRCMFNVLDVDYATGVVTGDSGKVYDTTDDVDYRIHMGVVHIAREVTELGTRQAYRRLVEGEHYDLITEGAVDIAGQLSINPETLIIRTRVRDDGDPDEFAAEYDSDPELYPAIVPAIAFANFISGSLRIEYEEKVEAGQYLNQPFKLGDVLLDGEDALITRIGQYDPRNMLGFAVGFTRELTTTNFYILPYDTAAKGMIELKKNRFILHIWNVSNSTSKAFSDWIITENEPKQSRFRIGYESAWMPDDLTKISATAGYSGILNTDPVTNRRKFTGTGYNFLNLGVAPGDTFHVPDSDTEYTVQFVSQTAVTFAERYSRAYDYTLRKLVLSGSDWEYDSYPEGFDKDAVTVKIKVRSLATPPTVEYVEGYVADMAAHDAVTSCGWSGNKLVLVLNTASYESIGEPRTAVTPPDEVLDGFSIDRTLNVTEKTNYMVANQIIENPDYVAVLSKDILFKTLETLGTDQYDAMLPNYAHAGIIFAAKITLVPHMPLTELFFDTINSRIGRVTGFTSFDRDEHLELLGDAGYCMLVSDGDTKPYCLSDFTTGYKIFKETDRGLLSKITPVRLYGKDVYETTKRFKGPYNTDTPELISLINVHLIALKDKYTTVNYTLLGTLLKKVAAPTVAFDGSFTVITHRITSQDPSRYIDNIVYVE